MKRSGASAGLALMGIASLASVSLTVAGRTTWSVIGWLLVACLGARMIFAARPKAPVVVPNPGTRREARVVSIESTPSLQRVRIRYDLDDVTHLAVILLDGDIRIQDEERIEIAIDPATGRARFLRAIDAAA